jgi:hypothetical protein
MNDQGQIKEFDSDEAAKQAGYKHKLTIEMAAFLNQIPEGERLSEIFWLEFQRDVLDGKCKDSMQKARYKNCIKYMCERFKK